MRSHNLSSSLRRRDLRFLTGGDPAIKSRWATLFDKVYRTERASYACVDNGVHAIVVPLVSKRGPVKALEQLEQELRVAMRQIPELARAFKINLTDMLDSQGSKREQIPWLPEFAQDVRQGKATGEVLVDLAYLEAALLHEFWDTDVEMEFGTPLSFFHRGGLSDYANVLEATTLAVAEGVSLQTAAIRLARDVARDLEVYAQAFLRLSSLYPQCQWSIKSQQFAVKIPRRLSTWNFCYWDLQKEDPFHVVQGWGQVVDRLLQEANLLSTPEPPKSYAA